MSHSCLLERSNWKHILMNASMSYENNQTMSPKHYRFKAALIEELLWSHQFGHSSAAQAPDA